MKMKSKQNNMEHDSEQTIDRLPVDRGWAWVVLLGCTCSYLIYVGTLRSFGLFFVEYLEVFGASVSMTSLVSAIQTTIYSIVSLQVLTYGLKFISVRQSVMIGAFLCSLSYILNSFATSIEFLVVTQSVIFGAGTAFLYTPGLIIVGQYFKERRGIANGIAVAGCSIGGLVLPPIYSFILNKYGLNGAMIITSGIMLQLFVVAAVLRPPSFYQRNIRKNAKETVKISDDESTNIKNWYSQLQKNDRQTSSQPMLITETSKFKKMNGFLYERPRSVSESPNEVGEIKNVKLLDKLSNSNMFRYLSYSEIGSQTLAYDNNDGYITDNNNTVKKRCSTKSKLFPFDVSLLKHPPYVLNTLAFCFGCLPNGAGLIFIAPFAVEKNVPMQYTAMLLSIFGAADLASRLLGGYLADRKLIRDQFSVAISQGLLGIVMHMARFCEELWTFVILTVMFGLCAGIVVAMNPTMILDITGMERYNSGVAIYALTGGISLGVTIPLLGLLRDYTGAYYMTFHFTGITSFISMVLYIIVGLLLRADSRYKAPQDIHV